MNRSSPYLTELRNSIVNPTGAIVGLVDGVLALCRRHSLRLDWEAGRCFVRSVESGEEGVLDLPLRKSVFRAILARIAKLCDDQKPGSFSPYGGRGELSLPSDPMATLFVAWVNTPAEQRLELSGVNPSTIKSLAYENLTPLPPSEMTPNEGKLIQ